MLLLAVISFDSKLACKFYECLSEEWSAVTLKNDEQKLHTSLRDTNFVEVK